ncbi:MAG: hypothetical protein Q9M43_10670 [Sulfurimonas sp.]|nr:hypothetical protein [Sulfurimonas sp.]
MFWATQWNRIISATISGMSDIAAITIGDGLANLSKTLITSARKLKKDMGVGKLANAYMSSTTLLMLSRNKMMEQSRVRLSQRSMVK